MTTPKSNFAQGDEFPDENWKFIFKNECQDILDRNWTDEFLFYEMARELAHEGCIRKDLNDYLKEVSDNRFPDYPFLQFSFEERQQISRRFSEKGGFYEINVAMLAVRNPIHFNISFPLLDDFEHIVENEAWQAATLKSQACRNVEPEDLMPLSNPGERAATEMRNKIVQNEPDPFDRYTCLVSLNINLEYPDTRIRKEFEKVLDCIRKSGGEPKNDQRGKGVAPYIPVRDFAAYRLIRRYRTLNAAREVAEKKEEVVKEDSTWRSMRARGEKAMEVFRSRWAVKEEKVEGHNNPENLEN